ncbi:MAG: YjjG family noncanonical pyrimidine nucleotidase [Bacteroidales bacterium]|nr:YjjG family noncanonical pyrimidine nucleotidase [Bacteroidales bacterium]
MKKKYQSVFFDLDNTLWDFNTNSRKAFHVLYDKYGFRKKGISFDHLNTVYHKYNDALWAAYRQGKTDKQTLRWKRFFLTLQELGIPDMTLARKLDHDYIETSKTMTGLVDGAIDILEYLKPKYKLFLLTNGFNEVQFTKIRNSGLEPYFEKTITSEMAGILKPHPDFFTYALHLTNSTPQASVMIGDDPETDIRGAANANIETVLFNPSGAPHDSRPGYEIQRLEELKKIL